MHTKERVCFVILLHVTTTKMCQSAFIQKKNYITNTKKRRKKNKWGGGGGVKKDDTKQTN